MSARDREKVMNQQYAEEVATKGTELHALATKQLDEWKAYLKTFPVIDEIKGYIDAIQPSNIVIIGKEDDLSVNATYSIPDELIAFAQNPNAPEGFKDAVLGSGVVIDDKQAVTPN